MINGRIHARMQRRTSYRVVVGLQILTGAGSALQKFIRMGSFQSTYYPHFLYRRRMAVLQASKSRRDGVSPLSQRKSFGGIEDSLNSDEKDDGPACMRSEDADHAVHLLTLKYLRHLLGLLRNSTVFSGK